MLPLMQQCFDSAQAQSSSDIIKKGRGACRSPAFTVNIEVVRLSEGAGAGMPGLNLKFVRGSTWT